MSTGNARSKQNIRVQEEISEMLGKPLSLEMVRSSVPRNFRSHITEKFISDLEASLNDPDIAKEIKENFLSYTNVLNDCDANVNIWDYVNAVKFISYKIMGYSIEESWKKVFPKKAEECLQKGKKEFINRYANGYNKSKIVNKIYAQTMIPSYVLNAPMYQRALNVLYGMLDDPGVKGMAKVKACETILNYTKPPEVNKAEVQVTIKQSDAISELRELAENFAKSMQDSIMEGKKSAEEVIEVDFKEVENGNDG